MDPALPSEYLVADRNLAQNTQRSYRDTPILFLPFMAKKLGNLQTSSVNGSYRDGGMTDQAVKALAQDIEASGIEVEIILLREYPIEFCLNCRACTQKPGSAPGECVHHDGMQELIDKIERADCYILAAPTYFGSVTANFKRFMERLVVYAYWPWDMNGPQYRKAQTPKKKALLVSSCAAPEILGRWLFGTLDFRLL
jgi:NAD(P)H-dependent FMN reductase